MYIFETRENCYMIYFKDLSYPYYINMSSKIPLAVLTNFKISASTLIEEGGIPLEFHDLPNSVKLAIFSLTSVILENSNCIKLNMLK